MLLSAKSELADLGQEHQREMEGLLDSVRMLTKELALQEYIQNSFIPREYQVSRNSMMFIQQAILQFVTNIFLLFLLTGYD